MRIRTAVLGAAVLLVGSAPWLPNAEATPFKHAHTASVSFTFDLDVEIDCEHTGNTVHISGPIGIGGSSVGVWYQNNVKGTKQSNVYSGIVEASIAPQGGEVNLVKQPSRDGSAGNPWIWYDALDGNGPQLVGRCVEQSFNVNKHIAGSRQVTVNLLETYQSLDCSKTNAAGHLKHEQQNPAVNGKLMFDNNVNKPTHPSEHAAEVSVGLAGATSLDKENDIKQGMGNPLVYLFPDEADANASAADLMSNSKTLKLGKCNQLY